MLEQVYTQKRDGTGAAPSYSKIKKVLRPRSPIFVNAEAVKRYAAVFAQ